MLLTACVASIGAQAASLRSFRQLGTPTVYLSDLFTAMGDTPDRELGPSPEPGDRIVVAAPQLAAIARDYGVDWRPNSGAEQVVLERGGMPVSPDLVMAALRRALAQAGAPDQSDVDMPGFAAPIVPAGAPAQLAVGQVTYDAGTSRFTALLTVTAPDMTPIQQRLSGEVVAVVSAASLTRHMRPGAVLAIDDLRTARVHEAALHGNAPLVVTAALGMALRHDVPPGQPLTQADVAPPVLVARNGLVRMRLEAGGLVLSAQGVALQEGGMGEHIRVQNPSSHAVVVAEVIGDGEVRVEPGRAPVVEAQ